MRTLLGTGFPLLVAVLALGACGGGNEPTSERKTPTEASTGTGASGDPTDCMEEAGVANVEEESDVWSGTDQSDGAVVTVERKASTAEAKQAARDAKLFWNATAGPYFVHGASREGGDSGTVTVIADCLRGSA